MNPLKECRRRTGLHLISFSKIQFLPPCISEPVFVNLLRSPGTDYHAWRAGTPTLFVVPSRQATQVAESIPRNRFLGSLNVYKYGIRSLVHLGSQIRQKWLTTTIKTEKALLERAKFPRLQRMPRKRQNPFCVIRFILRMNRQCYWLGCESRIQKNKCYVEMQTMVDLIGLNKVNKKM